MKLKTIKIVKNSRFFLPFLLFIMLFVASHVEALVGRVDNPPDLKTSTGRSPLCPRWALEPWVWEDNGNIQPSTQALVDAYLSYNVPVDNLWATAWPMKTSLLVWVKTSARFASRSRPDSLIVCLSRVILGPQKSKATRIGVITRNAK